MTNYKLGLMCGIAIASQMAASNLAHAAAPAAATDSAPAGSTVNEVVVTAFKRQISVQKIPASISAVTGSALAQSGIQDVRDLSKIIPNLNWGEHFGTTLVTLRGIGTNVDSATVQPTVAMYVDGIYLPRADMATLRAVDLDRVEVLRGPQGTLYGRNATGGAINFISLAPSSTFGAGVNVSAGSRSAYGVSAYVTGPVSPGVDVRLSGGYDYADGYLKARIVDPANPSVTTSNQTLNGANDTFLRAAVRFQPTSDLKVDLSVRYDMDTSPNAYQELFEPSLVAGPAGQTTEPNRIIANDRFAQRNETLVGIGAITWTPSDHLTVKSITGIIDHHDDIAVDDDSTATPLEGTPDYRLPSRSISQELNLIGDYSGFKWILGAYYFHENSEVRLPVVLENAGPLTVILGESSRIENFALFGDTTWSLTNRLRLNVGLRYNYESDGYTEFGAIEPVVPPAMGVFHKTSSRLLPKIALQYDVADDVNAYAQWSLGYKAGGANLIGGGTTVLPLYLPETISAYEIGVKSQWFNRRFTANVAAFYYDYSDLQITTDIPPTTTLVQNAKARVYGIEGDFRWNVTRQLVLQLAPTLESARFVDFTSIDPVFGNAVNLNDKPLTRAPDFTMNASAQYRIELSGPFFSSLMLQGSMVYNSTTILRYYNDGPGQSQPPYAIGNLSATLSDVGNKTQLTLFVNNVSDTLYKQQITNFGLGNQGNYGPPRTFGVRLSRKF